MKKDIVKSLKLTIIITAVLFLVGQAQCIPIDSDGDRVSDEKDNCPNDVNSDQADQDNDQIGNDCDNCYLEANPSQNDFDKDEIGDACDNCQLTYNPDQSDQDEDGIGDICEFVEHGSLTIKVSPLSPLYREKVMGNRAILGIYDLEASIEPSNVLRLPILINGYDAKKINNFTISDYYNGEPLAELASVSSMGEGQCYTVAPNIICLDENAYPENYYYDGTVITDTISGNYGVITKYTIDADYCYKQAMVEWKNPMEKGLDINYKITSPAYFYFSANELLVHTKRTIEIQGDLNDPENNISGEEYNLEIPDYSLSQQYPIVVKGVNSGEDVYLDIDDTKTDSFVVHKTKLTVKKNPASPTGTSVAGAYQEILRLDASCDQAADCSLKMLNVTNYGNIDISGTIGAQLYRSDDMSKVLFERKAKIVQCSFNIGTEMDNCKGDNIIADGIPINSVIRIFDASNSKFMCQSSNPTICKFTVKNVLVGGQIVFNESAENMIDWMDTLYYSPGQPMDQGGSLAFGAITTLSADFIGNNTTISVVSTQNFTKGEKIIIKGYDFTGLPQESECTIIGLPTPTLMNLTGCTSNNVIDFDYNPREKWRHNSNAIVYSKNGLNLEVPMGGKVTLIVKIDTSGAATNKKLQPTVQKSEDIISSDGMNPLIKNVGNTPFSGGILLY